jgi:excisionase family DNA binding protein
LKKITVLEYANLLGVSVKTIYKRIDKGQTPHVVQGGKKLVTIEDLEYLRLLGEKGESITEPQKSSVENKENESFHDAEIVNDSPVEPEFQIVSMEQTSFDRLISSIKDLADNQLISWKESYSRIEREYLEIKAENKGLKEKNESLRIEAIQAKAELKIIEIRVKELENNNLVQVEKNEDLKNKIKDLEKQRDDLKKQCDHLREEIKNNKQNRSLWDKINYNRKL